MRVRFTADFDYKPIKRVTIAYKAGMVEIVKRECGEQAIAAKKAIEIKPQPRGEEPNGEA